MVFVTVFFCLSRSEAGVLWGHNSNIYCVTVYESILMRFYHFFSERIGLSEAIYDSHFSR